MQKIAKPFTWMVALLILAGAPAEASPQAAASADRWAQPGALVVLSGTGSEALLLDPQRNRILARFPTGPDPRAVALSPDGRFAYVTSFGWEPPPDAANPNVEVENPAGPLAGNRFALDALPRSRGVTVLDLAQRRVHAVFQPAEYLNLGSITVASDGGRLWMTSEGEGGVVELDATTGEVKMLWKTEAGQAGSVAVSRDGRSVYVSQPATNGVVVIDRVTVVPNRVATGRRPTGLALAPGGSELWVTNSGEHTISVIKTRRPREVERFPSGGIEPVRISFHAQRNEAWISNRGSRSVTVLDIASAAVIAEIPLPGEPHAITFSDDGRRAFVSSPAQHRVFAIDVEARALLEALDAGSRPGGIAWSRHGAP